MEWATHAQCLLENFVVLTLGLDMSSHLLALLTVSKIFSSAYMEELMGYERKDVQKQRQRLCMDLLRRPYTEYAKFVNCLDQAGQTHLADRLRETERRLNEGGVDGGSASEAPDPRDPGSGAGIDPLPQGANRGNALHPPATRRTPRAPRGHSVATGERGRRACCQPCMIQEDAAAVYETEYKMQSCPRGYLLIIDNRNFTNISSLQDRLVSQVDCENLQHLFQEILGFEVDTKVNLKAQRMKEVLAAFAAHPNHQNNHCAAVAVLTHGEEGYLYGVDGAKLHINTMVALFNARQCPALAGKPKMFILQACRGKRSDLGVYVNHDGAVNSDSRIVVPTVQELLEGMQRVNLEENRQLGSRYQNLEPTDADILICYSTVPGFVSWRDDIRGTWFIQALCEIFSEYAKSHSVMDMMVMVNNEVAKAMGSTVDGHPVKQIPQPILTLRKPWYLYPCPLRTLHQVGTKPCHQRVTAASGDHHNPNHQPTPGPSSSSRQDAHHPFPAYSGGVLQQQSQPLPTYSGGMVQQQTTVTTAPPVPFWGASQQTPSLYSASHQATHQAFSIYSGGVVQQETAATGVPAAPFWSHPHSSVATSHGMQPHSMQQEAHTAPSASGIPQNRPSFSAAGMPQTGQPTYSSGGWPITTSSGVANVNQTSAVSQQNGLGLSNGRQAPPIQLGASNHPSTSQHGSNSTTTEAHRNDVIPNLDIFR